MKKKFTWLTAMFLSICIVATLIPAAAANEEIGSSFIKQQSDTGDAKIEAVDTSSYEASAVWEPVTFQTSECIQENNNKCSNVHYLAYVDDSWTIESKEPYPVKLYHNVSEDYADGKVYYLDSQGEYIELDRISYSLTDGVCTIAESEQQFNIDDAGDGAYYIWWEDENQTAESDKLTELSSVEPYKAQLGTNSNFDGEIVDLSTALYTFTAKGAGYTVKSSIMNVYLNIGGNLPNGTNAPTIPNLSVANGEPVVVSTSPTGGGWFYLKDSSSLHFPSVNGDIYWNRCINPCGSAHNIALFRPAGAGDTVSSSDPIPGYVRLSNVNEVISGKQYLIAVMTNDKWYVLYPSTSIGAPYSHIAKVVPHDATQEFTLGGNISQMFDNSPDNTWVFTGGEDVEDGFAETRGQRNYVGQFEEYIRWTDTSGSGDAPNFQRQRYTINVAQKGQTLNSVITNWDSLVTNYNPRAVAYMVQSQDTANDLKTFIGKALELRDGKGFAVIQTFESTKAMVNQAVAEYAGKPGYARIVVVNHTGLTSPISSGDHMTVAKQLAAACGRTKAWFSYTNYTEISGQPTAYSDSVPSVTWNNGKMNITVSSTGGFTYKVILSGGVTVSGSSASNTAAVAGLPTGEEYTLSVRSGSTQLKTTYGVVGNSNTVNKPALDSKQQTIANLIAQKGNESLTWLFMGDSITHGAAHTYGYDSVPQTFDKYLNLIDRPQDVVVNTAVSSATTKSTLAGIQYRLKQYNPDVVSIMLGTNDSVSGQSISVDNYKTNLESIINTIKEKNPNAIIILRSPTGNKVSGRPVAGYCEKMKEIADSQNLIYIDQYTEMQKAFDTYTWAIVTNPILAGGDKLHPGAITQLAMAKKFIKAVGLWNEDNPIANLDYVTTSAVSSDTVPAIICEDENSTVTLTLNPMNGYGETTLSAAKDGQTWSVTAKAGDAAKLTLPNGKYTVAVSAVSTSEAKTVTFASQEINGTVNENNDSESLNALCEYNRQLLQISEMISQGNNYNSGTAVQSESTAAYGAPAEVTLYEYRKSSGELAEGVYAIVATTTDNVRGRVMHLHIKNNQPTVDQCQINANDTFGGDTLTLDHNEHLLKVMKKDSGYTFQVLYGSAKDKYLTGGAGTLTLTDTPTAFTVTPIAAGGYTLSWNSGNVKYFISWNSNWKAANTSYTVNLYKQITVIPSMAQTEFKGVSQNQPLVRSDTGSYFRIPSLITLNNGWIMASSDIRWCSTGDNPSNIDTIVSISKDNGNTWNWEVVNYFSDQANSFSSVSSAAYIDPSFVQASDGKIWMIVDATPSYGGNMSGNRMLPTNSPYLSGFDSQGRMLVGYIKDTTDATYLPGDGRYSYDYYTDLNNPSAGSNFTVNGKTVKLYPICAQSDDTETGYYADSFANVYYNYGSTVQKDIRPVLVQQMGSSKLIHSNLFYLQSEWKVPCTFYLMVRSATVNNGSLEWGAPKFINVKKEGERFTGVGPGRGTIATVGGKERIIFPLYDNYQGNQSVSHELASITYSDDGGQTWERGNRASNLNGSGKSSESQVVVLPDGTLRMYSRNTVDYVSYTDSTDGGINWGPYTMDNNLYSKKAGGGCMVSFINVEGYVIGPDNKVYDNLIMGSYSRIQRGYGVIRIGSVNAETNEVTWLDNDDYILGNGSFVYSCLTQLRDSNGKYLNKVSVLAELNLGADEPIPYIPIDFTKLLGEGWSFVMEKP